MQLCEFTPSTATTLGAMHPGTVGRVLATFWAEGNIHYDTPLHSRDPLQPNYAAVAAYCLAPGTYMIGSGPNALIYRVHRTGWLQPKELHALESLTGYVLTLEPRTAGPYISASEAAIDLRRWASTQIKEEAQP